MRLGQETPLPPDLDTNGAANNASMPSFPLVHRHSIAGFMFSADEVRTILGATGLSREAEEEKMTAAEVLHGVSLISLG